MTALATRPDHKIPVGEQFDSARDAHIAAAARVRASVPERAGQVEILQALFADGDKLRKRAAEVQARAKARTAPVKRIVRKPPPTSPMVPIGPARVHVADLIAQGMRQQAIAQAAGVSDAAVSMLVRGAYKKGDAPRQEITADLEKRILSVEFVAPKVRTPKPKPPKKPRPAAQPKCKSAAQFKPAGERVGQCLACGALSSLYRGRLTAHVTHQTPDGVPASAAQIGGTTS